MTNDRIWLAAEYHFPSTYSIRIPGSSMANAKALPAPGPATVRLALIRTGIELFGISKVEHDLFPVIRSAEIRISPPERIAFSTQVLKTYKAVMNKSRKIQYQESISYREFAQANGNMTVFIAIPEEMKTHFVQLFYGIGYWGQANSFATCVNILCKQPDMNSVGLPLDEITKTISDQYSSFVSEFRSADLSWKSILPENDEGNPLKSFIYAWPLKISERRQGKMLLLRLS